MKRPPTLVDVALAKQGEGIFTFSNGTDWDYWADTNCYECWFWPPEGPGGSLCAFEGAAFMHLVTPELATLFGWTHETTEYGPLSGWERPHQCAFFQRRPEKGDDGEDIPPPPPTDPHQLVLLADPTEDLARFPSAPRPERVEVYA